MRSTCHTQRVHWLLATHALTSTFSTSQARRVHRCTLGSRRVDALRQQVVQRQCLTRAAAQRLPRIVHQVSTLGPLITSAIGWRRAFHVHKSHKAAQRADRLPSWPLIIVRLDHLIARPCILKSLSRSLLGSERPLAALCCRHCSELVPPQQRHLREFTEKGRQLESLSDWLKTPLIFYAGFQSKRQTCKNGFGAIALSQY